MGGFIVTIARGYGSGGMAIGKKLAENLGISCYDREILRLASNDSGINEALFAKADEKLKNTLLFKIAKNVYTGEDIPPDTDDVINNDKLFRYQAKVLKELAKKESFVVIGRCADFILKDYPNLIRVFIYYTGKVWNDARNYDLCLNSSAIGKETCVTLIEKYMELKGCK